MVVMILELKYKILKRRYGNIFNIYKGSINTNIMIVSDLYLNKKIIKLNNSTID